jgi:hypothetical protein
MCDSIFLQLLSEIFFILRRGEREVMINLYLSSCKVPVAFIILQWILNIRDIFSKNTQIKNFMKVRPMSGELFYVHRETGIRTDMTKLIVGFGIFANAPENDKFFLRL